MKTIRDLLRLSQDYLEKRSVPHARREADALVGLALEMPRLDLYLHIDRPVDEQELSTCREVLRRRGLREPLQHIEGTVDFLDCTFEVNPNVLIPRNETEILAQKVVDDLKERPAGVVWDVCCGSGCLGIAIKKACAEHTVVLGDVSEEAVAVARRNAVNNEVDVEVRQGDFLAPFTGERADLVVCNPPYLADQELDTLEPEVKEFEPKLALISGPDGTEFYRRLNTELPELLNPGAHVWLELGYQQGPALNSLFAKGPWRQQRLEKDWAGHDRFFFLEFE